MSSLSFARESVGKNARYSKRESGARTAKPRVARSPESERKARFPVPALVAALPFARTARDCLHSNEENIGKDEDGKHEAWFRRNYIHHV